MLQFFDKLENVRERNKLAPHQIWNLDKTGLSTVVIPRHVLCQKGLKQVGQITFGERGVTVTMCCCINAVGYSAPAACIFLGVHFKDHMLNVAPSVGLDEYEIILSLVSFHEVYGQLNLAYNHKSHITLEVVDLARKNRLSILTFSPHCSHRMQHLDVSVYGPFIQAVIQQLL